MLLPTLQPKLPSRRSILQAMAAGAGATAIESLVPIQAARKMDPVSARIQNDLVRHASFGIKRSGTPGDLMTAAWIAERLRTAGYKVDELDFAAPFLVQRSARICPRRHDARCVPSAPELDHGSEGVTARLALVRDFSPMPPTLRARSLFVVLPSGRYAALGRGSAGIGAMVWAAAKAGAVGVVIVTTGPSGEAELLNAPEEPGHAYSCCDHGAEELETF